MSVAIVQSRAEAGLARCTVVASRAAALILANTGTEATATVLTDRTRAVRAFETFEALALLFSERVEAVAAARRRQRPRSWADNIPVRSNEIMHILMGLSKLEVASGKDIVHALTKRDASMGAHFGSMASNNWARCRGNRSRLRNGVAAGIFNCRNLEQDLVARSLPDVRIGGNVIRTLAVECAAETADTAEPTLLDSCEQVNVVTHVQDKRTRELAVGRYQSDLHHVHVGNLAARHTKRR
jgi:hypothetical protein